MNPQLLAMYQEAECVVKFTLSELWQNCPRYIHRDTRESLSRYVTAAECQTPLAEVYAGCVIRRGRQKTQDAGFIQVEDWVEKIKTGAPDV